MKSELLFSCSDSALPLQEAALGDLLRNFHTASVSAQTYTQPPVPVILCIGTDRLIGDSLGPVVGTLLGQNRCPFPVYGTLADPVHALNLGDRTAQIRSRYPQAPVIAIDASLGPSHRIGCVSLRPHGLLPGAGVRKKLCCAGDISITGITNGESLQPYLALQTARLSTVMAMAEKICTCILGLCET